MSLDLEYILLGVAGGAAGYVIMEKAKTKSINMAADRLVFDCCVQRIHSQPLKLPEKEDFKVTGYHSYKAIQRYEKIYTTLQELSDTAEAREIEKLFKTE